ncbi:hypothetical protein SO694_00031383 [Aureococcus anophagefferens]|uniref:Polymerase nucleotidyl transferase domain-containing protein n=1 Tax=Aureococcus anophagefferens TaxID=44056 RepID=A0ABR1FJS0_AURAN
MGVESCEPVTVQLDALLRALQPSRQSEERRGAVFGFVDEVLRKQFERTAPAAEPFATGSFLSKTYLPDSDLDLTIIHPVGSPADGSRSAGCSDDSSSLSSVVPPRELPLRRRVTVLSSRTGHLSTHAINVMVACLFVDKHLGDLGAMHPIHMLARFLNAHASLDWTREKLTLLGDDDDVDDDTAAGRPVRTAVRALCATLQSTLREACCAQRAASSSALLQREDPLVPTNNLGLCVSAKGLHQIRKAFAGGWKHLQELMAWAAGRRSRPRRARARCPLPAPTPPGVAPRPAPPPAAPAGDGGASPWFANEFFSQTIAAYVLARGPHEPPLPALGPKKPARTPAAAKKAKGKKKASPPPPAAKKAPPPPPPKKEAAPKAAPEARARAAPVKASPPPPKKVVHVVSRHSSAIPRKVVDESDAAIVPMALRPLGGLFSSAPARRARAPARNCSFAACHTSSASSAADPTVFERVPTVAPKEKAPKPRREAPPAPPPRPATWAEFAFPAEGDVLEFCELCVWLFECFVCMAGFANLQTFAIYPLYSTAFATALIKGVECFVIGKFAPPPPAPGAADERDASPPPRRRKLSSGSHGSPKRNRKGSR